jgi:ABC-2 type transport system ATP-binding protein
MIIQTEGLTKAYGDTVALKSLDLGVPKHSIFGFLGPNGAGKTTTMKILLGLTPPTGGRALIFGQDIARAGLDIRARIGYLPQQPAFPDYMTARDVLRFTTGFFFAGPKRAIEARVDEMLALVGLADKADRPVKGFSGGERQRLGIAQAQINYPDLLILDEPAAALDPLGRRDVLDIMRRLRHETTVFYSTHILDDVQQVSDSVAILNRGELVAQGPIESLLAGSGNAVYLVTLKGDAESVYARVVRQPWVVRIDAARQDGRITWQVAVTDEEAAEAGLLRHILHEEDVVVTGFQRKTFELEEVFMDLVEGVDHGRV